MAHNDFINALRVLLFVSLIGIIRAQEDARIVNGKNAERGQFLFSAVIIPTTTIAEAPEFCGGSLIAEQYVLSTCSCLYNVTGARVLLGTIFRENYRNDSNVMENEAAQFIYNNDFDEETLENDIAIIFLRYEVTKSQFIFPINLPEANDDFDRRGAIVVGYGSTRNGGEPSDRLQFASMEVISNGMCSMFYPGKVQRGNICAIGRNMSSTCTGDLGGGLKLDNDNVIIGVTTFFSDVFGCEMNYPVGFTRVSAYLGFIRKELKRRRNGQTKV
ncbi:collagenase-like [Uranotaenia lowii]|uniref:collagenase-like n=1 Tax=Uranotaenia lowii TaxID=190385 RepID=UPI00247AAAE2|nr:collagenase-like [Uranotaenia lowii]